MTTVDVDEDNLPRYPPRLRLITGGNGTPPPTGDDWLSKLNKKAVFSCKLRSQPNLDVLLVLQVVYKHAKTILLGDALNSQPLMAVDPVEFSKKYTKHELIEEGGEDHLKDNEPATSETNPEEEV